MNFPNAIAARLQAALPRTFQEYPKWVRLDGKEALAADAEAEAAILASWGVCAAPKLSDESTEASSPDEPQAPFNLLSQPEKRGRKIISLKTGN